MDDPGAGEGVAYTAPPPFARPVGNGWPTAAPPGYGYDPAMPPAYHRPPSAAAPRLGFGIFAAGLTAFGTLLLLVSLLGLAWFTPDGQNLTTGDVRSLLDGYGDLASSLAVAYYSWLSWVLLLLGASSAVAAALPVRAVSLAFRIAGPIVSGFALLLTFGSIELKSSVYASSDDFSSSASHLGIGFWLAVAGFALIGAAAIIGPRKLS